MEFTIYIIIKERQFGTEPELYTAQNIRAHMEKSGPVSDYEFMPAMDALIDSGRIRATPFRLDSDGPSKFLVPAGYHGLCSVCYAPA